MLKKIAKLFGENFIIRKDKTTVKWKILFGVIALIVIFFIFLPLPLENFAPESQVITDCNGEIIRVYLDANQQWHIKNKSEIPQKVEQTFLTYEDRSFYYHPGFDLFAIIRAIYLNLKNDEIVSGGSTITMQTVRLLQPKKRTYLNKFYELLQAVKLEILYSKKDILQMYLNNTPYGGNIIGYETACRKYFRKSAENLSWGEIATLAILPNQPSLIMPGKNQQKLFQKRNKLLHQLFQENVIDSLTYKIGIKEPISNIVFSLPQKAIHFTNQVRSNFPKQKEVISSLDISLQNLCEEIVSGHVSVLENYGINNAAVLLIDNDSGGIKAYLGSQDYFTDQVDGVISPRSSGSILKPFLYAQAIDEGLLLPQTKLKDIPTFYDSFSPENSNGEFSGLVTMKQALVQSLNIPAIRVLNKFGLQDFYNFLNFAGVSSLNRDAEKYGLTLIIGGAETSLFDVSQLYYGLANYGDFQRLSFLNQPFSNNKKQYISPGAAYLVCDVMKDLNRPGLHYYWNEFSGNPNLAWKTGTSNGHKDAWAVGINPKWTIGVWVGNFAGTGNKKLVGRSAAGPILFDIFQALPTSEPIWFEKPESEMRYIEICEKSGLQANDFCPHKIKIAVPLQMKPLKFCDFHKEVQVNATETMQVCSRCWDPDNHHSKVILQYPPDVLNYVNNSHEKIPHNPQCPSIIGDAKLMKISYPKSGDRIYLPKDIGGKKQKLVVSFNHQIPQAKIYWYLDNMFLFATENENEISLDLDYGDHKLSAMDENGNEEMVEFKVISE